MKEKWLNIQGVDGNYKISNYGKVKGFNRKIPMIMKQRKSIHGYLVVFFRTHGKPKGITVHRLVALSFVDGHKDGLQVNHIDGNKLNNRCDNLEWVTPRENTQHSIRLGMGDFSGERHWKARLDYVQVKKIRFLRENTELTYKEIGAMFDSGKNHIGQIIRNEIWK